MTITIKLPPELENRLQQNAEQQGLSIVEYAIEILKKSIENSEKKTNLSNLLNSWIAEDSEEQKDTGQELIENLDRDRISDRKLFPEELRGITW